MNYLISYFKELGKLKKVLKKINPLSKTSRQNRLVTYGFIIVALIPVALFIAKNPFGAKAASTQASVATDTSTTSTTYVLMDSMTITPGAGDYMIHFSTSIKKSIGSSDQYVSVFVGGTQVTHTERMIGADSSFDTGDISSHPIAIHAYVASVGASDAIEIRWKTSAGTATAHERTLIVESITAADISQATATDSPTTTSTSDTQLTSMTLAPGAGDYLVFFSGYVENTAHSENFVSIYVNSVQVAHSERDSLEESSFVDTPFPIMTHAYVSGVGASEVIEIKWRTTAGTATAGPRTLVVQKVDSANITQVTATAETSTTGSSDTQIDSMTSTPGAGDYLVFFSTSLKGTNEGGSTLNASLYSGGSQITHSERQIYVEGSFDTNPVDMFPVSSIAYVTSVGASDAIEAKYRTSAGTVYAYERTLTLYKVTAAAPTPTPTPVSGDGHWKMDEGYGQYINSSNGDANAGTLGGSASTTSTDPTWTTEDMCVSEKCLQFDSSSSQYISFDTSITSVKSISFWVRPTSASTSLAVLNGPTGNASITASSGAISAGAGFSSPTIYVNGNVSSTLTANVWQHITITTASGVSATNVILGRVNTGYLNGFMDEVKIFDNQLTAAEVIGEYNSRGASSPVTANFGPDQSYLSNGLVGYWKMDENTGTTANDSSGNGTTLSTAGNTFWTYGKYGSAIETTIDATQTGLFYNDASTATTDLLDFSDTDSFSYTFWYSASSAETTYISPFAKGAGSASTPGYDWEINSSNDAKCKYTDGDGSGDDRTSATLAIWNDGLWHQVTCVMDRSSSIFSMYIDGVLQGTDSALTEGSAATSDVDFRLGEYSSSSEYEGKVDEVRIYNRALSPAEVSDLYSYAPGPVAHYKLDENTGTTIYDTSGNGHNGSFSGNPIWNPGYYGSGLSFDGVDDSIIVADNDDISFTNNIFSVSVWFKRNGVPTTSSENLVAKNTSYGNYEYEIYINTSGNPGIELWQSDGTSIVSESSSENMADGNWHHFAATSDGSTVRLYIDGQPDDIDPVFLGGYMSNTSSNLEIGNRELSVDNEFEGGIDDVRIYNYTLTAKQVASIANADHPAPGSPLGSAALHLKFDDVGGDIAYDSGSSKSNGNLAELYTCPGDSHCPTWTNQGKIGGALDFGGGDVDGVIWTSNNDFRILGDLTIATWAKVDTFEDGEYIIHKGETGSEIEADNDIYSLRWDTTSGNDIEYLHEYGAGSDESHIFDTNLSTATWYHISLVRDVISKKLRLYINGVLNEEFAYTNDPTGGSGGEMSLGTNDDQTGNELDGMLDDFRIYSAALDQDQINIIANYQGFSAVMGVTGTDSSGNPDSSSAREYCPPGNTEENCGSGDPSPIAYYKLDENTGTSTVYDTSMGTSATMNGSMTANDWVPGKYGSALDFDGSNDFLNIYSSSLASAWSGSQGTISLWLKLSAATWADSTDHRAFTIGADTSNYIYLNKASGGNTLNFQYSAGGTTETSPDFPNNTDFFFVTMTWDCNGNCATSGEVKYYYNGTLLQTDTALGTWVGSLSSTRATIGVHTTGGNFPWKGLMDDIRIYNYARTPAQIAWDYNRGKPVAHWKFDETSWNGTAGEVKDSSGNAINGTASGNATTTSAGKFNNGGTFDGNDDVVKFTEATPVDLGVSTDSYTVSAWFKTSTTCASVSTLCTIVSKDDGSGAYPYRINQLNTGRFEFKFSDGTTTEIVLTPVGLNLVDGVWHNIVGIRKGPEEIIYLYVDGNLVTTNDYSVDTLNTTANNDDVSIGNSGSGYLARDFTGDIDDVRVYNYALTQQQILSIMNFGALRF